MKTQSKSPFFLQGRTRSSSDDDRRALLQPCPPAAVQQRPRVAHPRHTGVNYDAFAINRSKQIRFYREFRPILDLF